MDVTEEKLQALETLGRAATPGPWVVDSVRWSQEPEIPLRGPGGVLLASVVDDDGGTANADFLAAAREAMPALVAEVRKLRRLFGGYVLDGSRQISTLEAERDAARAELAKANTHAALLEERLAHTLAQESSLRMESAGLRAVNERLTSERNAAMDTSASLRAGVEHADTLLVALREALAAVTHKCRAEAGESPETRRAEALLAQR